MFQILIPPLIVQITVEYPLIASGLSFLIDEMVMWIHSVPTSKLVWETKEIMFLKVLGELSSTLYFQGIEII